MSSLFLNVGCGPVFVSDERWMNIDLGARSNAIIKMDLRHFAVKYPSSKFDGIYSSHVIEHLSVTEAKEHLAMCFDRLNEGGTKIDLLSS